MTERRPKACAPAALDTSMQVRRREGELDIAANRRARKWTRGELARRALWALAIPLFRMSPRLLWGWRTGILRLFGAKIGPDVHIHPSVSIALPWNLKIGAFAAIGDGVRVYNLGEVSVGAHATVSQGAHLCAGTHDHRRPELPLIKAPILIGAGAWVCADAFIGPGVAVGEFAIIAARGVAMHDVPPWTIVAGNPAEPTGPRPPIAPPTSAQE
jgi:putative colanic acid biosynthesis acetyltransferase WcaF